ncbi:MAG: patatin-like phospholipase family protein [Parcubacteria group bacterium]|nr:patatin-like phospholipase family protein [Parcubacteria group bacterium]
MQKQNYVIYFGGGTMRGVFGAGVATAFEEANVYSKIKAVYAASAGVLTGAYFLSRQTRLGSSAYWENLGDGKFILSPANFLIGAWQRFENQFISTIPQEKFRDGLNIDLLMEIVRNEKPLHTEKIISQDIPFNVKLFNLDKHEIEYIDARRPDVLEVLRAGVNVFPYTHDVSVIDGQRYIDAAIIDIIGLAHLRRKHPSEKIVIVTNGEIDRKLRYRAKNILEGTFMHWMLNDERLYDLYASAEDRLAKDLAEIGSDENMLLVTPEKDMGVKSRTTDPHLLRQMYDLGIEVGQRVTQSPFMNS